MQEINPIHYRIHLEPDLETFSFQGHTEIEALCQGTTQEILLHALDLDVQTCKAGKGEALEECTFSMDPEKEEMKVLLPKEMSGEVTLVIDYVGEINNRMAGFYRSKYIQDGQEKYVGVTQFEESDARRAFPCFDHPLKKATFDVEMVIDETLVAISNSAVAEETTVEGGKKCIRFQRTPKMSTYLLFFGVGEFDFIEDPGKVLVRVATMPGMTKQGLFGLEFGRKSLEFSEDYYAIPYPFPKLDLIAIEDFAFGAMENWGAITFRENLLLHDPDVTSKSGENRICEVIAHEIAHQWFGNLVTPSDWKYLWLNESFATYFGYGVVAHYYPDWGVWDQFLKDGTNVALERDALIETTPIEIPGGEHVVINVSTAPIIYQKGGSILRQVEGHIGPENFKNGLRDYLKEHQYACASSHHLWESLEKASREPVTKMMKGWIEQAGFPMVEVAREGDTLVLTQQRFTYLPNDSKAEWLIPLGIEVHYPDGSRKTMTTLLDGETTTIAIGEQARSYKVNTGQTGFYRVKYLEPSNMEELGRRVADKSLSHEDRWGLENDLYAFLNKGEVSLEQYLGFLSNYSQEDACLPISSITSNLATLYLLGNESHRESILATGRPIFEKVMGRIGYDPAPNEAHPVGVLRDQVLWAAVLFGSKAVSRYGLERFRALAGGEQVHPDIVKSVLRTGAWHGDRETFGWLTNRLKASDSEHERMNILAALGSFQDKGLVEMSLEYTLTDVPDRNKFLPIGYLSGNPGAITYLWDWYVGHVQELEQLHPMHYERVIASIVPYGGLGREEEVEKFFKDYLEKNEKVKDAVALSLERLEIHRRMKNP